MNDFPSPKLGGPTASKLWGQVINEKMPPVHASVLPTVKSVIGVHRPGNGGGWRGKREANLSNVWTGGVSPLTLDCRCRSFFFARELGSLPKIVGEIRRVFSFE